MYLLSLFLFLFSFSSNIQVSNVIDYYARSYIVMDYNSGKVIEEKNKGLVRSVASISKLMTAYVAINYCDNINDIVVIGDEIDKAYGSAVYIQKGEELTLKELLYALLLRSGNDAALSIASFIGQGDISFFCEIVSSTNYQSSNHGVWHNKNKLINQYKLTTGGKTGVVPIFCEIYYEIKHYKVVFF